MARYPYRESFVEQCDLERQPKNLCDALCDQRRICNALRYEFCGNHQDRMRLCGVARGNVNWPRMFGTSPCFVDGSAWIIVLRYVFAAIFIIHWIASLVIYFKAGHWFMYLTHWSLTVETLYFIFAAGATYKAREFYGYCYVDSSRLTSPLPFYVKATWVCYQISVPASLLVVCLYHILDKPFWKQTSVPAYMNLFVHGFNFIFLMLDLSLGRMVFYLKYAVIFFIYILTYSVWTIFHFVFRIGQVTTCERWGGKYKKYEKQECPIYKILDWHNPWTTGFMVVFLLLIVAPLCHYPIWRVVFARRAVDARAFYNQRQVAAFEDGIDMVAVQSNPGVAPPAHDNTASVALPVFEIGTFDVQHPIVEVQTPVSTPAVSTPGVATPTGFDMRVQSDPDEALPKSTPGFDLNVSRPMVGGQSSQAVVVPKSFPGEDPPVCSSEQRITRSSW